MSLEQAILDRLEKRNEENARLQNIINDLERSAYASSKQERETYDALVAYIQKMRAQIESDRLEREQMQHQITELRSEHDRILEISKSLVPKSALKQAVMEAAGLSSEVAKLRAEVPLESTREALKNAVANLRQHKSDIAKLYELADEIGRGTDESIADVMKRLGDECARLAGKVAELEAQKSNASPIGYISKADYDAAVTAARENGIHKGESLSGFIWRQCEMLRKSQAENAPLNKVFIAICKQRGNLNEEIIYRAVDEASDAIKKLTA